MNDLTDSHTEAEATQTLAVLNGQADELRADLARLRLELAELQRDVHRNRNAQLLEANQKLVLALLSAESIAETAINNLTELTRSSQRDALSHTTDRAVLVKRFASSVATARRHEELVAVRAAEKGRDLQEANEQLVMAVLGAQELEAHAQEAHRQQIKFMAMVAHELRNPLTPIRIAASLLVDRKSHDELSLARLQVIIDSQVTHMSRLIGDLLDGSRISTGKLRLEQGAVEMVGILKAASETCRPAMESRKQDLLWDVPAGPVDLHGDAVRLAQIFSNLLDNASKYTPDGGQIALTMVVLDDAVTITVSDNGIGISSEALPNIFELFVQDARALTHSNGGLGIGLAVVRDLVEAHGGTVTGYSAGKELGSEFSVTLPRNGMPALPETP
ncbi:MAG TPA: HAMP domain-containing sensor histidine kinase [Rhodanobacter sp.]